MKRLNLFFTLDTVFTAIASYPNFFNLSTPQRVNSLFSNIPNTVEPLPETDAHKGLNSLSAVKFFATSPFNLHAGSARAFAGKGTLTVIGSVSFGTGDAMDDVLYSELSSVANAEIRLSDSMAKRRLFPAVDVAASYSDALEVVLSEEEREVEASFRSKVLPELGEESGQALLMESASFEEKRAVASLLIDTIYISENGTTEVVWNI